MTIADARRKNPRRRNGMVFSMDNGVAIDRPVPIMTINIRTGFQSATAAMCRRSSV